MKKSLNNTLSNLLKTRADKVSRSGFNIKTNYRNSTVKIGNKKNNRKSIFLKETEAKTFIDQALLTCQECRDLTLNDVMLAKAISYIKI